MVLWFRWPLGGPEYWKRESWSACIDSFMYDVRFVTGLLIWFSSKVLLRQCFQQLVHYTNWRRQRKVRAVLVLHYIHVAEVSHSFDDCVNWREFCFGAPPAFVLQVLHALVKYLLCSWHYSHCNVVVSFLHYEPLNGLFSSFEVHIPLPLRWPGLTLMPSFLAHAILCMYFVCHVSLSRLQQWSLSCRLPMLKPIVTLPLRHCQSKQVVGSISSCFSGNSQW